MILGSHIKSLVLERFQGDTSTPLCLVIKSLQWVRILKVYSSSLKTRTKNLRHNLFFSNKCVFIIGLKGHNCNIVSLLPKRLKSRKTAYFAPYLEDYFLASTEWSTALLELNCDFTVLRALIASQLNLLFFCHWDMVVSKRSICTFSRLQNAFDVAVFPALCERDKYHSQTNRA
jgi:hypothetical protein